MLATIWSDIDKLLQQNIEKSEPVNSTVVETVNTSEDKKAAV